MTERDLRSWNGVEAADSSLDEVRRWVVWGHGGAVPDAFVYAMAGNDIAEGIARAHDEQWASAEADERWVVIAEGDEDDVDMAVADDPAAAGFAAYLAGGKDEEMPVGYMRGTLRSDVGPRRKVNQPRPV